MTAQHLRSKRAANGITGQAVCQRVGGLQRSRLSDIERGYIKSTPEELQQIDAALDSIIRDRQTLAKLAADAGLPLEGIRLTGAAA